MVDGGAGPKKKLMVSLTPSVPQGPPWVLPSCWPFLCCWLCQHPVMPVSVKFSILRHFTVCQTSVSQGRHQRSIRQGRWWVSQWGTETQRWGSSGDGKKVSRRFRMGTLKSMTHFFLLPVIIGNILEHGRDTALKRSYRINITQVRPNITQVRPNTSSKSISSPICACWGRWLFSGYQQLLWETEVLLFRSLPSQILKIPKKIPPITSVYTPKDWGSCGYEVRTSQQSQLLIAGEYPVHTLPLRLVTHSTSATLASPRTKGPLSMTWQIFLGKNARPSFMADSVPWQPQGFQTLWGQLPGGQSVTLPGDTHTCCADSQGVLSDHFRLSEEGGAVLHKMPHGIFLVPSHRRAEVRFPGAVQKRMQMSGEWPPQSFCSTAQALVHDLPRVLVPRVPSHLPPSVDDPYSLTFLLFPGLLFQVPSCPPPPQHL